MDLLAVGCLDLVSCGSRWVDCVLVHGVVEELPLEILHKDVTESAHMPGFPILLILLL